MENNKNLEEYSDGKIGERIKELAKEKGYTQDQLSAKSNIEVATISRMYRGRSLTAQNINAIAKAMNADVGYIMTGDDVNTNRNKLVSKEKGFILEQFSSLNIEQLNQLYAVARTFDMF